MGVAMNRKPQMPLAVFETKPGVIKMTKMTITESADFNWHGYYKEVNIDLFFFQWRNSLYWNRTSSLWRLHDHNQLDTSHSVGLLWTNDQHDAETST